MSFSSFKFPKALATERLSEEHCSSDEALLEISIPNDEHFRQQTRAWKPAIIHGCILGFYTLIFLLSLQTMKADKLHGPNVIHSKDPGSHVNSKANN